MSVEDDNYNITMHEFAHVLDNVDDKHSPECARAGKFTQS